MLQIRLNKVEGGAKPMPVDTVTVACPDHLILADLPVAKSIGSASTTTLSKTIGRRSRRNLGERVHFCVRCDYPIAIYGRLSPCEHAFCLDCARSDSSCYLCDDRIQKIQTIKMMEGIFVCAAPHCLKTFLKRSEFESHIHERHGDLLQPNTEKEESNELDVFNITRLPSTDSLAKQSTPADSSTARPQPTRPAFSPSPNQSRDQPPTKPIIQSKPPPYYGRHPNPSSDMHPDNNHRQGFDGPGPYKGGPLHGPGSDQFMDKQQGAQSESQFPDYSLQSQQPQNFAVPMNASQGLAPPFGYPFPGAQPFHNAQYEIARQDLASEGGPGQASLLGFPPPQGSNMNFPDSYPRPWNTAPAGVPLEQMPATQGFPEGLTNVGGDPQGRAQFFQNGDYGRVQGGPPPLNPIPPFVSKGLESQGSTSLDLKDGKGVLSPIPLLSPPPSHPSQLHHGNPSGSGDTSREG